MSGEAQSREIAMKSGPTWRRLLASAVDAGAACLVAALPYLAGLIDISVYLPPEGLFWPDHVLVLMATRPVVLLHPFILALAIFCLWHFVWVVYGGGRTPGMRAGRLRLVDRRGLEPGLAASGLRVIGHLLSAMSLGLGWVWIFVSAHRRSLADLASDTWIVTSERP